MGDVADIAKLFDQIRRDLVFRICKAFGMSTCVLQAHEAYVENLKVYNCVAGGMGTPYVRICGIPQGCLFSMTTVALIMRPWIISMRKYTGLTCYILADDVLIIGTGMKMVSKFCGGPQCHAPLLASNGSQSGPRQKLQLCKLQESSKLGQRNDVEAYQQQHPCHHRHPISRSSPYHPTRNEQQHPR